MSIIIILPPNIFGDFKNYYSIYKDYINFSVCTTENTFCYIFEILTYKNIFTFEAAYRGYVLIGMVSMLYVFYRTNMNYLSYITFMGFCGLYIQLVLIRFGVAVSMSYLMIYFIQKNKILKSVICASIAFSFHATVIIFIGFTYFAYYISKFKKYHLFMTFAVSPFLVLVGVYVYRKYSFYESMGGGEISGKLILFVIMQAYLSLISLSRHKDKKIGISNIYEYFSLISVLAIILFNQQSIIASRLVYIFSIGLPFVLNKIYLNGRYWDKILLKLLPLLALYNLYSAKYWSFDFS